MKRIIILLLVVYALHPVKGQIIIQDSKGQDLFLQMGGLAIESKERDKLSTNINSGNGGNISLRLFLNSGTDASKKFHSFEVKVKANDGIGNIISNKEFTPGTTFLYTYGITHLFTNPKTSNSIDWFFGQIKYDINRYKLFSPANAFKEQLSSVSFSGFSLYLNYRRLFSGKLFFNVGFGYSRLNNYDDLGKIEITDETTFIDSFSKTQRTIGSGTVNARKGNYKEYDAYPLTLSLTFVPAENEEEAKEVKPGCSFYYTSVFIKNEAYKSNLGLVLFFTKADPSTGVRSSTWGLFVEAKDVFNAANSNSGLEKRFVFGINAKLDIFSFN